MKQKETITEENYKEKTLKRAIIICWILLAICFVVKICGGNFFDIVCNNENFIKFCNFCDTSFVRYIIYFMYFMFESIMFALILKPNIKIKDKRFILYVCLCVLFWIVKVLVESQIIKISIPLFSFISLIILFVLLYVFSNKPLHSFLLIIYQFVLVYLSSIIKSISFNQSITDSMLFTVIFFIDYFIALILTVLYIRIRKIKKERNSMGLASWFAWLGEDVDKLKVVLSMTKDEEQRKLLEEVIADLESKANESNN